MRALLYILALFTSVSAGAQSYLGRLIPAASGGGGGGGITLIDSISARPAGDNAATITSGAINTTGANFISVVVWYYAGSLGTPSLTDSRGNTYTVSNDRSVSNEMRVLQYRVSSPSVGTGHTFSFTIGGATCRPVMHITAWSGLNASPLDQTNGTSGTGGINPQVGSITPSVNGCLLICASGGQPVTAQPTISSSGWTNATDQWYWLPYAGSIRNIQLQVGYRIQTTAAATNPFLAFGGTNTQYVGMITSFKP